MSRSAPADWILFSALGSILNPGTYYDHVDSDAVYGFDNSDVLSGVGIALADNTTLPTLMPIVGTPVPTFDLSPSFTFHITAFHPHKDDAFYRYGLLALNFSETDAGAERA